MEPAGNPEKNPMKDDNPNHPQTKCDERGQWASKKEFIFAVAGEIIGLGNVWRFPYLCFRNGGGAFLVPYILILLTCGVPIFFLEVSLGQLTGQGGVTCWRNLCPLFEGIGYGSLMITFYTVVYYIVILAWAFLYFFSSFQTVLPWATCNNTWNTGNCIDYGQNISSSGRFSENVTSSVQEFWQKRILGLSGGIDQLGSIRWDLAGCLLLSWIICYFCIWKGVKTTGKVVYFTATFPYVMLIVFLIRGVTLPGALDGIIVYLNPNVTRLADPQVWMDAGNQIFFSYALCSGCLISMGSYNTYNNNCYKDTFLLCTLNCLTSFVAGFAVFSVLGFMSHELKVDILFVAESGPGLAFITYPWAISMMPLPQLWAALFFAMIIFLGLDSEFVYLECLVTSISDMYPSFFIVGNRRKVLLLAICVVSFAIGLFMVTEGGLYVFLLFDYYICSGMPIMLFAILETVCVGWIFGAGHYYAILNDMIGYLPSSYMKYCWRFMAPFVLTVTLLFSLFKLTPLTYNNTYKFPMWSYAIGICFALSSVIVAPLWVVYIMSVTPGTIKQRLKTLCTPAADLCNRSSKRTLHQETRLFDQELCSLNLDKDPKDAISEEFSKICASP